MPLSMIQKAVVASKGGSAKRPTSNAGARADSEHNGGNLSCESPRHPHVGGLLIGGGLASA